MDPTRFRQAMRLHAAGVCIVATGSGQERHGMTVSSVTSVSAEPPLVLVCLNRTASCHDPITAAPAFSVNILASRQTDVAMAFAGATGLSGTRKFEIGRWTQASAPVLDGALQTLLCEPAGRHDAGTHTILIGRVIEALGFGGDGALVNFDGAMREVAASSRQAA
ncbi:flavin reductase family protein [Aquibium microcysteis]|uniref:flavin reductase family protein n=1 Tax=Aquibium microcysteis TaxID=675281 RepID=UPI00165D1227|nr:flavin reductase family protein [Aquibium microcysteis]